MHFYCTDELANKLRSRWGQDRGRAGRLSANIERLLWRGLEESTPKPPKEEIEAIG